MTDPAATLRFVACNLSSRRVYENALLLSDAANEIESRERQVAYWRDVAGRWNTEVGELRERLVKAEKIIEDLAGYTPLQSGATVVASGIVQRAREYRAEFGEKTT